jgi:uncharacterized protein
MSLLQRLFSKNLIHPPRWLPENTHYLVIMGSTAYGCNSEQSSDSDVYGWCIPTKELVFPHLAGELDGFGKQKPRFNVWQEHHIDDKETSKQYDFAIYSVVHFMNLCMTASPNMVDALFTPARCVLHMTALGNIVRDNRKLFLTKKCWHTFKGYAFQQLAKLSKPVPEPVEAVKKFESRLLSSKSHSIIDVISELEKRGISYAKQGKN